MLCFVAGNRARVEDDQVHLRRDRELDKPVRAQRLLLAVRAVRTGNDAHLSPHGGREVLLVFFVDEYRV